MAVLLAKGYFERSRPADIDIRLPFPSFNPRSPHLEFEFLDWLSRVIKQLPEQKHFLGTKDYSFAIPQLHQSETMNSSNEILPDFFSHDPYEVLGLDHNEKDVERIKKQYRKLALKYHPDKTQGRKKIFRKINKAYKILLRNWKILHQCLIFKITHLL